MGWLLSLLLQALIALLGDVSPLLALFWQELILILLWCLAFGESLSLMKTVA
jgi:hypothetical protein